MVRADIFKGFRMNKMNKLLDVHAVCEWLSISRATLRRACTEGRIPKPIRVGRRGLRWRSHELREWIESQAGVPSVVETAVQSNEEK